MRGRFPRARSVRYLACKCTLSHRTIYRYQEPVKYTAQTLRLASFVAMVNSGYARHGPSKRRAAARNRWMRTATSHTLLTLEEPHREISIVVAGVVEIAPARDVLAGT